jgi:OOP family OmpA-OmpF porin
MKGILLLALLGLVALVVLCPASRAPAIEGEVRDAAMACAVDSGLKAEQVEVSGRDVTLKGFVPSEAVRTKVVSCVRAFAGTRVVTDRLQLMKAGSLHIRTGYGSIAFDGVVPSAAARRTLIDEATSLWGSGGVNDGLQVDPGRTLGAWSADSFAAALAALHHSRRELDVELANGQAVISGTVLSELARHRVVGAAGATLPEFEIVDRLTVREPGDARERLQAELDRLLAGEVVEFATDSDELTAEGRSVLDEVVTIMRRLPGRIEISGHTDSTGTPEHNLELSRQRAESAARYLVSRGISSGRFETVGHGANRPVASNATAEGRQANRRTEFHSLKES